MTIVAVVAVAEESEVDVLRSVGGVPMVVRAVRCLLDTDLVDRVLVSVTDRRTLAVERVCSGLPVLVGDLASAEVRTASPTDPVDDDVVLLHDAARPLAPSSLAIAVVDAVRAGHEAAVPVLPLTDTVKQVDAAGLIRGTPDRAHLRVVQTPQAIRRELFDFAAAPIPVAPISVAYTAAQDVHTVPGDPLAFAVRSPWDLELAELWAGGR